MQKYRNALILNKKDIGAILYLIPTVISENALETIPKASLDITCSLKHFIVERARTSRRYLRAIGHPDRIDSLQIIEFEKEQSESLTIALGWLKSGHSVGIISESGMPGIADPGSELVTMAHKSDIKVKSLVGPSSINLALAASGFNGQNFSFGGYLPIKENPLRLKLKTIENEILKTGISHIFIETPYRNNRLLNLLIKHLSNNLELCVALDITGKNELIIRKSIASWKKKEVILDKLPCIFLLGK